MTNVLLLTSSPRGEASISTQVARGLVSKIEGARVTERALWKDTPPHISPDHVGAGFTPEAARTAEQREILAESDRLIAELFAADVIVIAVGMINFSVPSTLKVWMDHVSRVGVTFRFGANGVEGLVAGKKAILVQASGAVYTSGPYAPADHAIPYLKVFLGFLGITDVECVYIEGLNTGAEIAEQAVATTTAKAASIAASLSH